MANANDRFAFVLAYQDAAKLRRNLYVPFSTESELLLRELSRDLAGTPIGSAGPK